MKTPTKVINVLFVIAGISSIVSMSYLWLSRNKASAQVVKPIAYTTVLRQSTVDMQGQSTPEMLMIWAVRSDGSQVTQFKAAHLDERIIDFASGEKVLIDDAHQTKSTTADSTWTADRWLRGSSRSCLTEGEQARHPLIHSIATDTIAGYRAIKITRGNATSWYALDYGCAMIQSTADWGNGSRAEQHLVSFTSGEPDASLFAISDQFRETIPSQMACSFASNRGGDNCGLPPQHAHDMDAQYYAHRPL